MALVVGLAVLAMLRAQVFVSEEALWRDTLAKNPAAWCAHANLGWILASQQKYDEARAHLEASLELQPGQRPGALQSRARPVAARQVRRGGCAFPGSAETQAQGRGHPQSPTPRPWQSRGGRTRR